MALSEIPAERPEVVAPPLPLVLVEEKATAASIWPETDHRTIAELRDGKEEKKQAALIRLYRAYEKPVRRYIRLAWKNLSDQDAEDIAVRFYHESLIGAKAHFLTYDPERLRAEGRPGRLRSYFSCILSRELANHHRWLMAKKRGGGATHLSLDSVSPAAEVEAVGADERFLSDEFDRLWAHRVVELTLAAVQTAGERQQLHDHLLQWLRCDTTDETLKQIAEKTGHSYNAVRLAYSRLKRRWQAELRRIVVRTLADPNDLDDELNYLSRLLGNSPEPVTPRFGSGL